MRVACLLVPDLSLVAALRAAPHLATAPLAIVQAGRDLGGRALVIAANPAASCVAAGMTLSEARSLCPALGAGRLPRRSAALRARLLGEGPRPRPRRRPGRDAAALRPAHPRRDRAPAAGASRRAARPGRGTAPPHRPRRRGGHFRPPTSAGAFRGGRRAGMGGDLARATPLLV